MTIPLKYKVVQQTPLTNAALQTFLTNYGGEGWELSQTEVASGMVILKQVNLPAGCAVICTTVLDWLFGPGGRK
jgi:hypothetical protein